MDMCTIGNSQSIDLQVPTFRFISYVFVQPREQRMVESYCSIFGLRMIHRRFFIDYF